MKVIKVNHNNDSILYIYNVKNSVIIINRYYLFHIYFVNNFKIHNEKFQAEYLIWNNLTADKFYYYNNKTYAPKSIKHWKKQAKLLKRQHNLKVFK